MMIKRWSIVEASSNLEGLLVEVEKYGVQEISEGDKVYEVRAKPEATKKSSAVEFLKQGGPLSREDDAI